VSTSERSKSSYVSARIPLPAAVAATLPPGEGIDGAGVVRTVREAGPYSAWVENWDALAGASHPPYSAHSKPANFQLSIVNFQLSTPPHSGYLISYILYLIFRRGVVAGASHPPYSAHSKPANFQLSIVNFQLSTPSPQWISYISTKIPGSDCCRGRFVSTCP